MALCGSCECPVVQDAPCEAHGAVYLYITLDAVNSVDATWRVVVAA